MKVDFGYITDFDQLSNTGWLTHTLLDSSLLVTFRFQLVENKYPDLTARLRKNTFLNLRVYYEFKNGRTMDEGLDLWPQGTDLPDEVRAAFKKELENIWLNPKIEKPLWLDSVTKYIRPLA